jgi:hypothetical protein
MMTPPNVTMIYDNNATQAMRTHRYQHNRY